jgi:hypothetical protein
VEDYYRKHKDTAAVSNRPQKLPYFTFVKRKVVEVDGKPTEVLEPDFDTIEAHGEVPTEVDIILMAENPWRAEYQMWSATELKCHGDGMEAMRVVSMGGADPAAAEAKKAGEKYFPLQQCFTNGCPYAGKECKPNGTLTFQLAKSMRIGATAYFTSTGMVTVKQMFSALEILKLATSRYSGGLMGLPVKMVLSSFKANHEGKPTIQPCVGLEMRAEDMAALRLKLEESAWTPKAIEAAHHIETVDVDEVDQSVASSVAAEFYPAEFEEGSEDEAEPVIEAKRKTDEKTSALAEKLRAKAEPVVEAKPVVADAATPEAAHESDKLFGDFGMS